MLKKRSSDAPRDPPSLLVAGVEHAHLDEGRQGDQEHLVVRIRCFSEVDHVVVPVLEAEGAAISPHPSLRDPRHLVVIARVLNWEIDCATWARTEQALRANADGGLQSLLVSWVQDLESQVADRAGVSQ